MSLPISLAQLCLNSLPLKTLSYSLLNKWVSIRDLEQQIVEGVVKRGFNGIEFNLDSSLTG
ncbi:hypothetical protein DCAR_0414970 [Daucus carota subsp. sativus]|uniref:Uncharacterized protein n=1 Tax=Daucus carota subsp. sativus TaxID=79200 RepID=A0A162A870_DAUCS|nr:hypothetical protein DCAR_0414970 [Daucus carota subsp. sativus]